MTLQQVLYEELGYNNPSNKKKRKTQNFGFKKATKRTSSNYILFVV